MTTTKKIETTIETTTGEACRAVFIPKGARYGLDDVLVAKTPMVEFYTAKADGSGWWFTGSRFEVATLRDGDEWSRSALSAGVTIFADFGSGVRIAVDAANVRRAFASFVKAGAEF